MSAADPPRLGRRLGLQVDVPRADAREQRFLWEQALGAETVALNGSLDALTRQFDLDPHAIAAASVDALRAGGTLEEALWRACRTQSRPKLDDLAQRLEPVAGWDDIVLPAAQLEILREVAAHVRGRQRVYDDWGFARKSLRGLGVSALFEGVSGTGKTMAAEVLALELDLDLYRIDLSQVVSKYIGETEKNLRRVFDAAETGGTILLFDEADALFGKRTEVKDSHDRYANIEVSYLLQRMEAYRGLAILTTNQRDALDQAFARRLRFVVDFPFPDAAERAEIWRRVFPSETPTEELDPGRARDAQPRRREHPQHRALGGVPRRGRGGAGRHAPPRARGRARVHQARAAALGGGGAGVDVRVVLEELVLDGVDPRDPLVARALEHALAQSMPGPAPVSAQELAAAVVAALAQRPVPYEANP